VVPAVRLVHHAVRIEMKGGSRRTAGTTTHTELDLKPITRYW